LGYPKAALFAFTLAVLGYNTLTCVKGALAAVPGHGWEDWSTYYLAWEVKASFDGMQVAVPEEEWRPMARMTPADLAEFLRQVAQKVIPARYAKHRRGPKKSMARKKVKSHHESTAKLLQQRKQRQTEPAASSP